MIGRPPRILVVDDESEIRGILRDCLKADGYEVFEAEDGAAAVERVRSTRPAVVLLDIAMPKKSGLDALPELKEIDPELPVVICTAAVDVPTAVKAMRLGAYDYLTKPFDVDLLLLTVKRALERRALQQRVEELRSQSEGVTLAERMGSSRQIQEVIRQVAQVAKSNFTVVIQGETGTGKELVARAIHQQSARAKGPFVAVDCGAIPETLVESELFGYEKGAFTGAHRKKDGQFQFASGGTLFLDEIGNLPLAVQAKLLRAIEERQVTPLGSNRAVPVDVRIIAASNIALEEEVRTGRFRADLYYRLSEFAITLPPLRERQEDIAFLAQRFLAEVSMELRHPVRTISDEALALLLGHSWPGNVRELKNVIRKAALLAEDVITPEHLPALSVAVIPPRRPGPREPVGEDLSLREVAEMAAAEAERQAIRQALEATRGNKSQAARLLRTDYTTLHAKMKRYGINARDFA
jgi:two-component system nitrogen regulation response regulator GlnG